MDPNVALEKLRKLCEQDTKDLDEEGLVDLVYEIQDHFNGLDNWIVNGGFLPKNWKKHL